MLKYADRRNDSVTPIARVSENLMVSDRSFPCFPGYESYPLRQEDRIHGQEEE